MASNQTKVSSKRIFYLILTIVLWAAFVGLEIMTSSLSKKASAPHKSTDVDGILAPFAGVAFILAVFALVLAIVFTILFIKSNRKDK